MSGKPSTPAATRGKPPAPASARSTPAEAAEATTLQPPATDGVPDEESIRARAHSLWAQAGSPEGDGVEFWLRAEQELRNPR